MTLINSMMKKFTKNVIGLQEGLHPENLAFWYSEIIKEAKDMAPPWLADKINAKQDSILPMKFNLDISKRAVRYFMIAVDNNLEKMPSSTKLYFLKVQESLSGEMDKSLV
ncbi:MAG: hypothetical protein ACREAX_05285 [Candidatus Nitrosotenuis sp.]